MKILFPIGSFYPAQEGGPDNSVYWLNRELNNKGIDTTVVSTMKGIKDPNIKPGKRVDKYGARSYFFNYYGKHFICPGLYKWVFRNVKNYDLIHINSIFFPMSLIVAFIANSNGIPFVISPRGELDEGALYYCKVKKLFYLKLVKSTFTKAYFFHATCENERDQIEKYFGKNAKCFVIPNTIGNFKGSSEEVDIYKKFSISKNSKYILYLGRISPKKAIENLIEAFASINYDNVKLIIAGNANNSYGQRLGRLTRKLGLSKRAKFVGHVFNDVKESLYSNAELLVLPSHTENFGNVVLEALNKGVPVIASKGTPWQCLEDYKCGFWTENNPYDLSRAITYFLNMKDNVKKVYRVNARKLVREKFAIDVAVREYINLYNSTRQMTLSSTSN